MFLNTLAQRRAQGRQAGAEACIAQPYKGHSVFLYFPLGEEQGSKKFMDKYIRFYYSFIQQNMDKNG